MEASAGARSAAQTSVPSEAIAAEQSAGFSAHLCAFILYARHSFSNTASDLHAMNGLDVD